jgi:hypothetical protein
MALHEQALGASDEWYTPPHVFEAMGDVQFDLDVAHPGWEAPCHVPAWTVMTAESLSRPWYGFVWMNPPFGARNGLAPWLEKFFEHGNGVALVPDRTSAPWWQEFARKADALLFVGKKLRFIRPDGSEGKSPAQGTTLLAAGPRGVEALQNAARNGLGLLTNVAALRMAPQVERERSREDQTP